MSDEKKTLYERLGGYDAIAAVANDLLLRLRADPQLGRFWAHRGEDGIMREKQLLIDFLCASAGGPMYYRGRDMVLIHRGMRISDSDWNVFLGHAAATLAKFQVPEAEQRDVVAFGKGNCASGSPMQQSLFLSGRQRRPDKTIPVLSHGDVRVKGCEIQWRMSETPLAIAASKV